MARARVGVRLCASHYRRLPSDSGAQLDRAFAGNGHATSAARNPLGRRSPGNPFLELHQHSGRRDRRPAVSRHRWRRHRARDRGWA